MPDKEVTTTIKEAMTEVEWALCAKMRPTFLTVSPIGEDIYVVVSCASFSNKNIQERISMIFRLLSLYVPFTLEERLVVVSAFSSDEIDEVLEDIFTKELN